MDGNLTTCCSLQTTLPVYLTGQSYICKYHLVVAMFLSLVAYFCLCGPIFAQNLYHVYNGFNVYSFEDNLDQFGPVMNISWNQAYKICTTHNASLLSFSTYNDIFILQSLLIDILNRKLPLPVFLGLKKYSGVSGHVILTLLYKTQ